MSDSRLIGGSAGRGRGGHCDGERGKRGERGERGERGHRGPRGPRGFAAPLVPFVPPFPAESPTIITIFARQDGSDEAGTGSRAEPFRTFQRAIRQVPNVIAPGFAYIVDVTDLGVETFPAGYQIPPFQATVQAYLFLDPSTLPFVVLAALNIRAFPRPFSALPLADTVVPAEDIVAIFSVGPGLTGVQVTTPRASWAANGAQTAMVIGDGGNAQVNSVVFASDTTHLFLANTPSQVEVQKLSLVEPSAVFSSPGPGGDGSGWESSAAESLAIQGIKFTIAGGGTDSQVVALIHRLPSGSRTPCSPSWSSLTSTDWASSAFPCRL